MNEENEKKPTRTAAVPAATKKSWWPGWIWAVPVAALVIGGWLLIRFLTQGGTDITISFDDAYGIQAGDTTIQYRGTKVGDIDSVTLSKDGKGVKVTASIQDNAAQFLKTDTFFYLRGAEPSLSDLSSLGSILSGPSVVMEPGAGKKATHFKGLARKPQIPRGAGKPVYFQISFDGSVGDLKEGDGIKLRGFPVGEVKTTSFHYDAANDKVITPVTIALCPNLFHIEHATATNPQQSLKAMMSQLVDEGLRANLDRDPPLIGGYQVSLEMVPGAPKASLNLAQNPPEIPVAPGGGLQSIVDKFKNVPIDQIAQNALDITHQIDQIVASPKLKDTVAQLDASMKQIHETVNSVGPKIDELVKQLRDTSQHLDAVANVAKQTLAGQANQNGLPETLNEMKEAARAVRSLADYLERHPEALIKGKSGD